MKEDPYSLDNLRDIIEPDPVSWWPPAPGWWFVIALLAIWIVAGGIIAMIRWRRNAYRRNGLQELASIESSARTDADRSHALTALSALLKRVALSAFPRENIASLTGDDWIAFLNRSNTAADFSSEPTCQLAFASYEQAPAAVLDVSQFTQICTTVRTWIETHQAEADAC